MVESHASICYLFPPSCRKSTLLNLKVATSSHLGSLPRMHNFDGITQEQGCSSWSSGSFLVHLLREIFIILHFAISFLHSVVSFNFLLY